MCGGITGRRGGRWSAVLVCSLFLHSSLLLPAAQEPQAEGTKLRIVILEGEGAINNTRQRTARDPIVQVEDENRRPVAGAVVLFTLPDRGASGTFANGATSMTVTTDAQGRAVATGLRPNNVAGQMQIRVNASYQGQTARATINQTNAIGAAAAGAATGKIVAILAIAGGAAAAGAVAATRGGSSRTTTGPTTPSTPTPTTVTAGTPSISPPPR